jgi:hypothetical protein
MTPFHHASSKEVRTRSLLLSFRRAATHHWYVLSFFSIAMATSLSAQLVISELMYHPAGTSVKEGPESLEYIELYNPGSETLVLDHFRFVRGIDYQFPEGTRLRPQAYLVIAADSAAVMAHHGIRNVIGNYDGQLSNTGEVIRVEDAFGDTVLSFRYGTTGAWPPSADGAGHSLVFNHPERDNDSPANWGSSLFLNGSPGIGEPSMEEDDLDRYLVQKGTSGYYFKGRREPSGGTTEWTKPGFKMNASWIEGRTGYGYSNNNAESAHLSTTLSDMRASYIALYARIPFQLTTSDLEHLNAMVLVMHYDDSFVVYLNGVRVGSEGVDGNPPAFDQTSNAASDYDPVTLDLTSHKKLLNDGENWLAIQGHNAGLGVSSDFVMGPELRLTVDPKPTIEEAQRRIVFNEIFTNGTQQSDFVELYNPSGDPVDIGGMWLSDSSDDLMLYQIPGTAIVPPEGFLVMEILKETNGFALSSEGESLFLTTEDGTFIASSQGFGPMHPDMSVARFPDGHPQWFYQRVASPGNANQRHRTGPVMLNEVMYHPLLDEAAEYIELRNTSLNEISIGKWKISGVDFQFSASASMAGESLALLAGNREAVVETFNLSEGIIGGEFAGRLSNGGEPLGLLDAYDVAVDWVELEDSAPWPVTADGLGSSVERACWDDRINVANQWLGSPMANPTPGVSNTFSECPPDTQEGVVISEFLYHAASQKEDDQALEFIKLQNTSHLSVDLTGWIISGSVFFAFPEQTMLQPGKHLTVAGVPGRLESMHAFGQSLMEEPFQGDLPNGGGEIVLIGNDGRLVDQVAYDDDFPWPSLADGFAGDPVMGFSLLRACDLSAGDAPSNWLANQNPSPHLSNDSWTCHLLEGPLEVRTQPGIITPDMAPVIVAKWEVNARLDDIQAVFVEYFADDHESVNEPLTQVLMRPMVDSAGAEHRDQWSASMPTAPANTVIRYRIKLQTRTGPVFVSPAPHRDAMHWHAYFVDPQVSTQKPNQYHMFIASKDWKKLHAWTSPGRVSGGKPNPNWNNEIPATFISRGQVYDVTVRHQGSRWNRKGGQTRSFDCPSHLNGQAQVRSWRIRFPSYRNWDDIDTLILQKQSGWPQRVSFKMFEVAGVPAPHTSWADLRINGCSFNGDAFQIERPGRDLVDRWFEQVGDLFKSQGYTGDEGPWSWGDGRLIRGTRNGFNETDRYEYTYNRKTHQWFNQPGDGKPDRVEPMIEGLHQARKAGKETLRAWLEEHFDVTRTLRYICTINYVGTFDDMFQNHYLYRSGDDGKWCMFPWDMDNTLGGSFGEWNANPFRGAEERRIGKIGNRAGWWNRIKDAFFIAYEQEFLAIFHQLNNTVHAPQNMMPLIENIAVEGGYQSRVAGLMNHLQRRHDYLNAFIEPRLGAPSLDVDFAGANLILEWEEGRTDYDLEFSTTLSGPWKPMAEGRSIRKLTDTSYMLLPVEAKAFFRLSR